MAMIYDFSPGTIKAMLEGRAAGHTLKRLALRYGCSPQLISYHTRDVVRPHFDSAKVRVLQAIRQHGSLNMLEVAEYAECSPGLAWQHLRNYCMAGILEREQFSRGRYKEALYRLTRAELRLM